MLDIQLDEHFMNFFIVLVFLPLSFWKESKSCYFSVLFTDIEQTVMPSSGFMFLNSLDDKVACQKILDKMKLEGYQVNPMSLNA